MLEKKDITFAEVRKICEQSDDLCAATNADTPVLFHRRSTKPLRDAPNVHNSPQVPQVPSSNQTQPKAATNRCFSCGEYHFRSNCRFRNATCHAYGNMGHIRKVCRMPKCNLVNSHIPTADENSSPIYTLQTTEPNSRFVFAPLRFEFGVEHRFIMDTGSSESIRPKSALIAICPNAVLAPNSVRIHGVTGHQLQLLGVQSESGVSIPTQFLELAHRPSILGLRAMRLLQGNVAIKPSNCVFGVSELEFLGFTFDSRPDSTRFKPLNNIESPKDQTHLRSMMGCLQYYFRFIPNFATRAQPLFRAQCSDAWEWSVECEDILRDLIRCVTDRPVLAPFSPSNLLCSSPMRSTSELVLY
ncbi:unnamed protein product [Echinostoma caproni]|uniref:Peptidase A2 domain-containing protein n=1 Tax=Echinostoma caproni TaxID=27848 RepID=A0A183AIC6_9TREM|nr:unnamed protein product [Echinostoma caproni]